MASIYGFCQEQAKTDDGYFLGFPSLWNVVAFYLYVLPIPAWGCLAIVLILSVLTFVPSKYLYPSQPGRLNQIATLLGLVWTLPLGWVLLNLPESTSPRTDPGLQRPAIVSLFYPVFYLGASWIVTWRQSEEIRRVAVNRCSGESGSTHRGSSSKTTFSIFPVAIAWFSAIR